MEERSSNKLKLVGEFFKELEEFTPSEEQLKAYEQQMISITKVNPLDKSH